MCLSFVYTLRVAFFVVSLNCDGTLSYICDLTKEPIREGNLGKSGTFPWLGLLSMHIYQDKSVKVALTGLVLIKRKHAVGCADDLARVSRVALRNDAKAMFMSGPTKVWSAEIADVLIHPEYSYSTFNTIALVELTEMGYDRGNIPNVCLPMKFLNKANKLYTVRYTDERKVLEKYFHKMKYTPKRFCQEYYSRAKKTEPKSWPTQSLCAYTVSNKTACVWDNAMALVTNSSGPWVLVGIGTQGPGCAAPSRYIEIFPYLPWIESAMGSDYAK